MARKKKGRKTGEDRQSSSVNIPIEEKKKVDNSLSIYKTPVVGVMDNIVFTTKAVWAYYILAEKPYDFLSSQGKVDLGNSTIKAFSSLCRKSYEPVELHLLITNTPFDPASWEEQMYRVYNMWNQNGEEVKNSSRFLETRSTEPFHRYVENTALELRKANYMKRVTFIGIRLLTRGAINLRINPFEVGFHEATQMFKQSISNVFSVPNDSISQSEEEKARRQEREIFNIISTGGLKGRRASAEEILLTMKSRYYPAMPAPYLEVDHETRCGLSDIAIETGGEVHVFPRKLKFVQFIDGQVYEGYRSTLTIAEFPREMTVPSVIPPFFSRMSVLPFTCSARLILTPTGKMKDELNKKKLDAEDEIQNLANSGQRATASLVETVSNIDTLEEHLNQENQPWVSGSYHITIEGNDEEVIDELIAEIRQEYNEADTVLLLTNGDQLPLFREEQIGGEIEIKDFQHITNLALLASAGINFGGSVGDPIAEQV